MGWRLACACWLAAAHLVRGNCVVCPAYVALSAHDKLAVLWNKTTVDAYAQAQWPNAWPSALELLAENMDTTFDRFGDESNRPRTVHAHGMLAQVRWESHSKAFTGVYTSGSRDAIVRLSLAGKPGSFSPGFAIKFLIDGQTSANLIGMVSLEGQGNCYNFFQNQLKTSVALPVDSSTSIFAQVGLELFESGATPATKLLPDQPSLFTSAGVLQPVPVYPTLLYLVPNPALTAAWTNFTGDFRTGLAPIPQSTLLYTVYAATAGCMCASGPCDDVLANAPVCAPLLIASIYTASPFVASPYGDGGIFFRHSRWFKKSRQTCVYAAALDDANADSTVLPTVPGDTAMCAATTTTTTTCPVQGLVSAAAGCEPEDKFLFGAAPLPQPAQSSQTALAGIPVAASGLVAYWVLREWRRRRRATQVLSEEFIGLAEMPRPTHTAGGYQGVV